VHILSGSPRQLRERLEEKLRIDRVRWDELTLKPNLSNLLRLRFSALRDQLGYKLPVLLAARVRDQTPGPDGELPTEVLVGDDAEADAFVYSLYADLCSGTIEASALQRIIVAGRIYPEEREACLSAHARLAIGQAVRRIFIHLDRQSPPSDFDAYGPRVVPFYNYVQPAFVLAEDGYIGGDAVLQVAAMLIQRHRFDAEALGRSYLDLLRRGHARGTLLPILTRGLENFPAAPLELTHLGSVRDRIEEHLEQWKSHAPREPTPPGPPDYEALARRHRGGRNRKGITAG
jgi:hypothetical protein